MKRGLGGRSPKGPLLGGLALVAAGACTTGGQPPLPQQLPLASLISMAQQGQPYPPNPQIPMSAIVTPPGLQLFYASPPFSAAIATNTGTAPVVNVLPGLVEGKFAPYVTLELWLNNYGTIWYDPIYRLTEDDGSGGATINPASGLAANLTDDVYSVAPPDRFYTPYWALEYVIVPQGDAAKIKAHPPKSVRDVLDLNYPIVDGPNGTWPIVPDKLAFDPALQPVSAEQPDPTAALPSWMRVIAQAEYPPPERSKMQPLAKRFFPSSAWWEGKRISIMAVGIFDFVDQPVNVVQLTPLFMFVDLNSDGSTTPLGLPNVMGHGPLFSNSPVTLSGGVAGGTPNWDAAWEIYQVVRPVPSPNCVADAGSSPTCVQKAEPFFPVVPDPENAANTDLFGAQRMAQQAPMPSDAVNALTEMVAGVSVPVTVARYAGRLALNPSCFQDGPADPHLSSMATWAASCRFLDSQAAIEAEVTADNILDTQTQALCPLVLWANPNP